MSPPTSSISALPIGPHVPADEGSVCTEWSDTREPAHKTSALTLGGLGSASCCPAPSRLDRGASHTSHLLRL
ncbi:unnamed protein product [Boreogadus saida]